VAVGPGATALTVIPFAAQLLGEDVGHDLDGGLGRRVDGVAGQGQADHAAREVDNAPAGLKARRGFAHRVEAALDVHGEQAVEGLVVGIGQLRQPGRHDAGVVDQHIDAAVDALGFVEQAAHRCRVGHVGLHCRGLAAGRDDVRDDLGGFVRIAGVVDDHRMAVLGQTLGDGGADAAGRSGDDGDGGGIHSGAPGEWV
jgi:hypothetical protein